MKVAVWSPLPPQKSGIADYVHDLILELREHCEVIAVVRDGAEGSTHVPIGVTVVSKTEYDPSLVDIDMYHFGNHPRFHAYMYESIIRRPGVLVLHDLALPDFHWDLCGGFDTEMFYEEVRFDSPEPLIDLPRHRVDDQLLIDWLKIPLSRRVVEASDVTVVHSAWAQHTLSVRYPSANVVHCYEAARVYDLLPPEETNSRGRRVAFGVFGGISPPKRIMSTLRAFARIHESYPDVELIIAGRSDVPAQIQEISSFISRHNLNSVVDLSLDVAESEMMSLIARCDAAISLRWPTVGETSASLMSALGCGRTVITSDIPQNADFDSRFCWRIPIGDEEVPALTRCMECIIRDPSVARRAGRAGAEFVRQEASFPVIASQLHEILKTSTSERRLRTTSAAGQLQVGPAVNAIGDWTSRTGVAEAGRRMVGALLEAGVSVALETIEINGQTGARELPTYLAELPPGRPYRDDVCFLNVNEMNVLSAPYLRSGRNSSYVIGNWYWELPDFPPHLRAAIETVDEIWVPTEFVASSFRAATTKPVVVVPCVVEPKQNKDLVRSDFGLPENECIFLYSFDPRSGVARKNPLGLIEAFRSAFSPVERQQQVKLVIKTSGLRELPEAHFTLSSSLRQIEGILVDEDLTPDEMGSLLAQCDVYVSLHRAEGFGLGLAEAMFFGKPVITTSYSGPCDFATSSTSCPVGYRMVSVGEGDLRYNPGARSVYAAGQCWAEPDIEHAAQWMRYLYRTPEARARIGKAAAASIRNRHSAARIGDRMRARLIELNNLRRAEFGTLYPEA